MPESPCIVCDKPCAHTEDDPEPLCDVCIEAVRWKRLILDIALERVAVPPGFLDNWSDSEGETSSGR